jgi:hypothetical protein
MDGGREVELPNQKLLRQPLQMLEIVHFTNLVVVFNPQHLDSILLSTITEFKTKTFKTI